MSNLSGNRWVLNFTTFLVDLIKENKNIKYDKVIYECMIQKGVKGITTEKYIHIMVEAGIINIMDKEENGNIVRYIHYKGD